MIKLKPRTWANDRLIKITKDEPDKKAIEGDEMIIRYLLRDGKAACHHIYLNNEAFPLETDKVIDSIHDMPWNEEKGVHEFPGLEQDQPNEK